jgi:hypothetical protein
MEKRSPKGWAGEWRLYWLSPGRHSVEQALARLSGEVGEKGTTEGGE